MTKAEKTRSYTKHLINSIEKAHGLKSSLPKEYFDKLESMAPVKTRHFLNNLCSLENARYLEVGLFKGGSFLCSAHGNPTLQMTGIENFSEFQDDGHKTNGKTVEQSFLEQIHYFSSPNQRQRMKVLRENAFGIDVTKIGQFDIYFYDGNHSREAHRLSLTHFDAALADPFILVVDDWCCSFRGPHDGTLEAISRLGYRLRYFEELVIGPNVFVAVVEKPEQPNKAG